MNPVYDILWTAPAVILASLVIGWGAETAQFYISQGLALAILAWLQTFPEFAVEATIAWHQQQDLMIANLTGSLRILVGLGWPLVYFARAFFGTRKARNTSWPIIKLPDHNGLEVFVLLLSTLYFLFVWIKGSLTMGDSILLFSIYGLYLYQLTKHPIKEIEEDEDIPWISHKIMGFKPQKRWLAILGLFIGGGLILEISVDPFLHSMKSVAALMGISSFFFIQWFAPFVSEFPEKITAFQWARKEAKAPMALMNLVSSNIVQWSVMAGMIPIVFSLSKKTPSPIFFDHLQLQEILLTILQSLLSILFLMDLEMTVVNALGLFVLWIIQFIYPPARVEVMILYGIWGLFECIILARKGRLTYALLKLREMNKNV